MKRTDTTSSRASPSPQIGLTHHAMNRAGWVTPLVILGVLVLVPLVELAQAGGADKKATPVPEQQTLRLPAERGSKIR